MKAMQTKPAFESPSRWNFPDYYRLVPRKYLAARHEKIGAMCRDQGLAGILLTKNTDLYYVSGTMQQGAAFVDASGRALVFSRRHAERAQAESPLEVITVSGFSQVAGEMASFLPTGSRLGLCLDVMGAAEFLGWQKRLPGVEMADASWEFCKIKGVKDAFEIQAMTEAGQLAVKNYARLPELIRPGRTEAWVAAQMVAFFLEHGHIDLMRTRNTYMDNYGWHLVSGEEGKRPSSVEAAYGGTGCSPAFPQGASLKPLREGETIVVDLGVCLQGYQTDQTRTYIMGPASDELKRGYECLAEVEKAICAHLRPGAVSGELFDLAMETAADLGYAEGFLGLSDQRLKFVGHGLGLEMGAPPYLNKGSKARVMTNEAYALELKMIIDQGPLGLENTFLVNEDGPPTLLTPIPDELCEIML